MWEHAPRVVELLGQLRPELLTIVLAEMLHRLGIFVSHAIPCGYPQMEKLADVVKLLEFRTQTSNSEQGIIITAIQELLTLLEAAPRALDLCRALTQQQEVIRPYKLARICRPRAPAEQLAEAYLKEAVARDGSLSGQLSAAECDAATLRSVGADKHAVTASYLAQLMGTGQVLPPSAHLKRDLSIEAVEAATKTMALSRNLAPTKLKAGTVENCAKQFERCTIASKCVTLARVLRWVCDPLDVLHTAEEVSEYHKQLVRLLGKLAEDHTSRSMSTLSAAVILQVNMHKQAVSLLSEVKASR